MLIVANWKAYVDSKEKAKKLYAAAKRLTPRADIVLAMPLPYLGLFGGATGAVALGAQDVSVTTGGAQTGEVTAAVLGDIGARYVIVGHSERRAQGETDIEILEKVRRALAHKLTPILCIGESERDEEARYLGVVRGQLAAVFGELSQKERLSLVVAYEPVWAIGKTAAESIMPSDLGEMVLYIRKVLGEYLPGKSALEVPILYGGSAEPENARGLAGGSGVDGFLVGHASVDPVIFTALVKAVS
ncbi:MAG TPA: triose-phosphate isomerase family protein [Candidatus Paceibacterota bacterium]|nr:triose-phosphate isomerase family protein [Candidatus Paceibacterota bacterium]